MLLFSPFVDLSIPFSLPGTLVSSIKVVAVGFRQHCVHKARSYVFLFAVASHCGWTLTCTNVIQVSNPCFQPGMGKLRLPVDPSFCHLSQIEVHPLSPFCSTPQCVSSLVVMLLPQVRTALPPLVEIGDVRQCGAFRISKASLICLLRLDRALAANRICREVLLQKRNVSMMGIELMIFFNSMSST